MIVGGSFIQVWFDVGWVPLDELRHLQYGSTPPIPVLGDFWGIMLIGVILVPAIVGGAALSEALKRRRARKRWLPLLQEENRTPATVTAVAWSAADRGVVMTVNADGRAHELCDTAPLGRWHLSPGADVALWTTEQHTLVVGTGEGFVSGPPRSPSLNGPT